MTGVTAQRQLRRELDDITSRHTKLLDDQAFVVWFVESFAGASEDQAVQSLPGRAAEKGIDGVFVDGRLQSVFLVQAKLRQKFGSGTENRNDVLGFASMSEILAGAQKPFAGHLEGLDPQATELLRDARARIQRGYGLELCYVTTGRCSEPLRLEATRKTRSVRLSGEKRARFSLFDGVAISGLLKEWLEGAAPPVPSLDLPIDGEEIRRTDDGSGSALRVFWMNGYHVADLYRRAELRVFHRNVRGYLGLASSEINTEMFNTLSREPHNFVYLNNGVTIVCDGVTPEETRTGRRILVASNPQIINGQQTTRVLAEAGEKAKKAVVLVRVIAVPHSLKVDEGAYDRIVSQVVRATNHQNAIKPSDLRSNDRIQVYLDRELRKLGYHYARKRQTKREIRRQALTAHFIVTKQEFAQAVAATLEEGLPRRLGRERLFEDPYYGRVFGSENVYFYLARFRFMRLVNSLAYGSGERQWAKFVALFFVWNALGRDIERRQRSFVVATQQPTRHREVVEPIQELIDLTFKATRDYYTKRRGKGPERLDLATFYKRKDVYAGFERFWRGQQNPARRRAQFRQAVAAFRVALSKVS